MQRPDEAKRREIMAAAARLFAARPFQDVRLDEIAAEARVGKGTLYIYFESKETLYGALVHDGYAQLIDELKRRIDAEAPCWREQVRIIVRGLVRFGRRFPDLFRTMLQGPTPESPLLSHRGELTGLLESAIRRGVREGQASDPHPELTAQYLVSAVRGAMLYGPADLSEQTVANHILRVLDRGITAGARR